MSLQKNRIRSAKNVICSLLCILVDRPRGVWTPKPPLRTPLVAEAEVWSDFNNNHYSKFCKSRNFVNIQPNFLSARKKKDQPLRLVCTESKIVSVRAYNIYSIYIRIKSFILLTALREACNEFVGPISTLLRPSNTVHFEKMSQWWRAVGKTVSDLTGPRFEPQTSRTREERVIPLDHLDVAKVYCCLALN